MKVTNYLVYLKGVLIGEYNSYELTQWDELEGILSNSDYEVVVK